MGREWMDILYNQYVIDYASDKLYLLELTMLGHQPGDKNSANRMSTRVKEIANGLESMLNAAHKTEVKKKDDSDGKLTMIG